MAIDSDPAGGFRTKDPGAFWFGSDARPDAVVMDTDGNLDCDGDLSAGSLSTSGDGEVTGDLVVTGTVSTTGLDVVEGTNARMGTATLVDGAATVATTAVTATSRIFLTSQEDGGTEGFLRVSSRTAATSFVITSSSATDTSTVAWMIVEPAA